MNILQAAFPNLHELVRLFYDQPGKLARFQSVRADAMSGAYRALLDHDQHMTVTLESHHASPVDVHVLEYTTDNDTYARKILLSRQSDGKIVQFGIVRLHWRYLSKPVRDEIESQQIPLGRVLINHNVLRRVELGQLWDVRPGVDLCQYFQLEAPLVTYARTAIIHCDDEPAVELLEIVTPKDGMPAARL